MKKPILVIMAAGIGSRFGGGIKQLAKVGPSGELVIDYSLYDAREAGFEKVIFIIRHDIEEDFKEMIGDRMAKVMEVEYAYQELKDLPGGRIPPRERTKPFGTGHAILACRGLLDEPFAVINSDDYYGKEAFRAMYRYLENVSRKDEVLPIAMAGFVVGNTLSENGTVTRGVCRLDDQGDLCAVEETKEIVRQKDGIIHGVYQGKTTEIPENSLVSMNFWGFVPEFIPVLEREFECFLDEIPEGDLKAEYLLPNIVDQMIKEKKATVAVLPTADPWFGITYQEDKAMVEQKLALLAETGIYPTPLFFTMEEK